MDETTKDNKVTANLTDNLQKQSQQGFFLES
jgi:hypothetical protein